MVDAIIVPGMAEEQVPAFTSLLMAVAEAGGAEGLDIAETAVRHAYTQTDDFVQACRRYSGWRPDHAFDDPPIQHEQSVS